MKIVIYWCVIVALAIGLGISRWQIVEISKEVITAREKYDGERQMHLADLDLLQKCATGKLNPAYVVGLRNE